MTIFNSRWKEASVPTSDIATLKYPYHVKSVNGELVDTIPSVEDAESLLDWYKGNYDHGRITQSLVRRSPASRKLQAAAERRAYLSRKAERRAAAAEQFEATDAAARASKEAKRQDKLATRAAQDRAEWAPPRATAMRNIVKSISDASAALAAVPVALDTPQAIENYAMLLRHAGAIGALLSTLRTQHHTITSSRHFLAIQKNRVLG